MKKHIRYIIDTLACRFSKHFILKNAKMKWVIYRLGSLKNNNVVRNEDSTITRCIFNVDGNNNRIKYGSKANIYNSSVNIVGNGNSVIFEGCYGSVNLLLRGNDCLVHVFPLTGMESAYMVCMGNQNSIIIGTNCMLSADVEIWNTDSHLITDVEGNWLNVGKKPVVLGNHVWVGKHVRILKDVSIGDDAIIGMSSVVTRNIPNNAIAVGNPAKVVKDSITWRRKYIDMWENGKLALKNGEIYETDNI